MTLLKKVLFSLFSIFLSYQSIEMMQYLGASEPMRLSPWQAIALAFFISLCVTGVFAFLGFAFQTNRLLPQSFYKIKNPKLLNQVYTLMGVKYFRMALMVAFWGRKKNRTKFFDGTRAGFENLIYQTKQSEFGHLGAFVIILIFSLFLIKRGYGVLFMSITLINLIGNLYPIILQRKHRFRIERIMKGLR